MLAKKLDPSLFVSKVCSVELAESANNSSPEFKSVNNVLVLTASSKVVIELFVK